jgi:hypothetical protein
VPFSPTAPPIPAIGFTTKPIRRLTAAAASQVQ